MLGSAKSKQLKAETLQREELQRALVIATINRWHNKRFRRDKVVAILLDYVKDTASDAELVRLETLMRNYVYHHNYLIK